MEKWLPVPGYDGLYEVSSFGNVKSLARTRVGMNGKPVSVRSRIRKPAVRKNSYLYVMLYRNAVAKWHGVHQLVLRAFVGECPAGMECRHLDGNPSNNKISNLKYGTRKENQADRRAHGTVFAPRSDNSSGHIGVFYESKLGKWRAYITSYQTRKHLGVFNDFSSAP